MMALRILIYEDNNDLRESLAKLLTLEGNFEIVGHFENCINIKSDIEKLNNNGY
jgi:DNA-binding NarL/FixJ family response regulator